MSNYYLLKVLTSIFIVVTTLVACGNSQATPQIRIVNRLPTLTPTVSSGNVAPENSVDMDSQTEQPVTVETPVSQAETGDTTETGSDELVDSDTPTEEDLSSDSEVASPSDSPIIIVARNAIDEYVDIKNVTDTPIDLRGWSIFSEKDAQKCNLAGTLAPTELLRIWALASDASKGGYNCGFSQEIWADTEADAAILYNVEGIEVSRMN
ncbi:lamin tail domain-containing protein [Anaerolineales bacterium HSG24]|nr:lamin tail domain-containing protein [Anaerolineales bacterium HSG24]